MPITYEDIQKVNETLKTTDIKGKDYIEVNERIRAFRMLYPSGYIRTELLSNDGGVCVFRAEVGYTDLEQMGDDWNTVHYVLGTGTAYEREGSSFINKTSYIENCETSAVGRALGMAGIGIQASVASADEVQNAIANQTPETPQETKDLSRFTALKNRLMKATGASEKEATDAIIGKFGNPNDMSAGTYNRAVLACDAWVANLEKGNE